MLRAFLRRRHPLLPRQHIVSKRDEPKPDQKYRHYKGKIYKIEFPTSVHTETEQRLVNYREVGENVDPTIWARPLVMFQSQVSYSNGSGTRARFELITDATGVSRFAWRTTFQTEAELVLISATNNFYCDECGHVLNHCQYAKFQVLSNHLLCSGCCNKVESSHLYESVKLSLDSD